MDILIKFIFKDSAESVVKTLSIFETPQTNCSNENCRDVNVYIRAHIEDNSGPKPLSLARYVDDKVDVLDNNDTAIPINHLLQSMWDWIKVRLGKLNLTESSTFYPYCINPLAPSVSPGNKRHFQALE